MKELRYFKPRQEIENPIRFETYISRKTQNDILHRMLKAEELLEKGCRFTDDPLCVVDYALNFKDEPEFLVVSNPFALYASIAGDMTAEQAIKERKKTYQENPHGVSIMSSVKDFMEKAVLNNKIQHFHNEVNFPTKNPLLTINFTYPFVREFDNAIKNYSIDNATIVLNFGPVTIDSPTYLAKMPSLSSLQVFDINRNEIILPSVLDQLISENKLEKIINPAPDWSNKYNEYGININIDHQGWIVEKSI